MNQNAPNAAVWENIPYFERTLDLMGYVKHVLEGSRENGSGLSDKDVKEVVEIAMVHVGMYETWDTGFFGASVPYEAYRNMMMIKDQKLNLTNDFWRNRRVALDPVIAVCTHACTTFESVFEANRHNLTDEVVQMLWSLRARRYDFLPWLVFVATGDPASWTVNAVIMGKTGSGETFQSFKSRVQVRATRE